MHFEYEFPGNCGIACLVDFDTAAPEKPKGVDWFYGLHEADFVGTQNIVAFSGAAYQKKHVLGPRAFADWLETLGEEVYRTIEVKNPRTKNKIQAFIWTPSKAFLKTYTAWLKKFEKKSAYEQDYIHAAHFGEWFPNAADYDNGDHAGS